MALINKTKNVMCYSLSIIGWLHFLFSFFSFLFFYFFLGFFPLFVYLVPWPGTCVLYESAPTLDKEAQGADFDSSIVSLGGVLAVLAD